MISFLKVLFSLVFVWVCYVVISTSLEHNLFKEWNSLGTAWMHVTLWDFYANILIIYLWICYNEKSWVLKILWLVLVFCLGSIATCGYVLIQLFKLKPNQGIKELLLRND
ncbi:DUF1475 family protein [Mucilaginibacter ginkgonis]|uniref:DUF1475 family protein n=1 Tax=Mucilaginibacter ginkgonis TaxID=2682091 RepID=A0A6I4HUN2_9SPHI|nr:DUF1475 family protein [Mucilaginibacter ginkgonis]QQL50374.1 DUF1475 family protein [Mucilaginibacter ginkgonis]